MALIICPECQGKVSNGIVACPHCGFPLKRTGRGFFGKLLKWSFIAFNILMLVWLVSYWGKIGGKLETMSEAGQTGAALGAAVGTGIVMLIWAAGDVILGLLVLVTRPERR